MARQIGEIKITGTIDNITFYKMNGRYYARLKSSLTRRRVLTDPAFHRSLQSARRLALASQLASRLYRSLPQYKKTYALYCTLKTKAIIGLKKGIAEACVTKLLQQHLLQAGILQAKSKATSKKRKVCRTPPPVLQRFASCTIIHALPPVPIHHYKQRRAPCKRAG